MTTEQNQARTARCQRIREAEGLVELATVPACRFGLDPQLRQQLAKRAIRLVLELQPDASQRWQRDLVLGQALRLLKKYDLAVRPLLASVRRNPAERQGWIALGWCLKRTGELERAANVAAKGILHHPNDAVLHYNLACYLALLQQSELAISEIIWALELKPQLRKRLAKEPDFKALRDNDAFQAIVCQPQ
jgi:tetratricopeptide (TPR) repeat protein